MKKICMLLGAILVTIISPVASQDDSAPIICLLVDVDTAPSPGYDEIRSAEANLQWIFNDISDRDGTGTILLTQDVAYSRIRLLLAQYTLMSNYEFAISGYHSDDKMSTMTLPEQEALMTESITAAKASKICGTTDVNIAGFMPPGFDQNEDTYRAMDDLGIDYNAGFQAGLIYAPGHEEDVWPYQVEGYNFYAVPISTVDVSGELMPLYDKKMAEEGIGADEWAEILKAKLDVSAANEEPTVVLISTSTSGTGDYLSALGQFLDYAVSENAAFVNARDLVTMAKTGSLTPPEPTTSECINCGENGGQGIEITLIETPGSDNETSDEGGCVNCGKNESADSTTY